VNFFETQCSLQYCLQLIIPENILTFRQGIQHRVAVWN